MARAEFSKPVKRAARERSGGKCEAVGVWYGLCPGVQCNAVFGVAVEFDHVILEANSHDNSLENCAAVCVKCHHIKTRKHDTPLAAKTLRQQDKHRGIRKRSTFSHPTLRRKLSGEVVARASQTKGD